MKKIRLNSEELAEFFMEQHLLRQAGISEKEALQMMLEDQNKKAIQQFLSVLINAPTLLLGLEQLPLIIPEYIIALLRQATANKNEIKVLHDIANHLTQLSLTDNNGFSYRRKLKSCFFYPSIILLVLLILILMMSIFVIPVFDEMFKSFGKELPSLTQWVVNISIAIQNNIWWILIIILTLIGYLKSSYSLIFKDKLLLHFPIVKEAIRFIESATIIKTLQLLCSYQFNLADALRLSATAAENMVVISALTKIANDVSQGLLLQDSLKQSQVFASKTVRLLTLFEKTQQLQILDNLAQFHSNQIQKQITLSLRLLNVILLISCWLIVGIIVIGMYLPIFAMGAAVG